MAASDFLLIETYQDIERLVREGIEENLNLDYKASPALARDSKIVEEMCKDVSAFANSAGGQIIYGVAEDKKTRKPTDADPGVTDDKVTREWIEQVINSKVHPRISGIRIIQISNGKGGSIFAVTIFPSQTGPHQAPDKRYYKRFDLQSVAMEDYEIRDVLNRAVTPELYVKIGFPNGREHKLEFKPHQEVSESVPLMLWIGNRSKSPAEYARILVGLDADFHIPAHNFSHRRRRTLQGTEYETFVATWSVLEKHLPIFKEAEFALTEQAMIAVHSDYIHSTQFNAFIGIQAPGFSSMDRYHIRCQNAVLKIYGPLPDDGDGQGLGRRI